MVLTAIGPGSVARSADVRKSHKYEGLCDRYVSKAVANESSGMFGRDADAFISRLVHLSSSISGHRRGAEFLANVCQLK